jgi:hypothetical protein
VLKRLDAARLMVAAKGLPSKKALNLEQLNFEVENVTTLDPN